ncbi:hypothetical protein SGCZBJ_13295 [Caulobacter zeae]|uniref:Uncharacterized protein n=1 Tax=Caulobacter zeae TaxID=2055137 RepID=A0A2N5DGM5_9CAUL|nr:hypothetical protein [Caulobacter zeae]PLR25197.1 hypothetical protein SGCZBJ_13295 [Caulobacter zeae]
MPVQTATSALHIDVQNKMLYDQRAVSTAPAPDKLHVMQLKGGGQNILTNGDFDNGFRRYYPDPASLSGWSVQTVGLPGLVVASMTIGYRADGSPRLFVSTPDVGGPTGTIYELAVAADGELGAPVPIQSCASAASSMLFLPQTPVLLWSQVEAGMHVVKGAHGDKLDQTFYPHTGSSSVIGGDMVAIPNPPSVWPNLGFVVNTSQPEPWAVSVQSTTGDAAVIALPALTNASGAQTIPTSTATIAYPDGTVRLFATAGDGVVQFVDASQPSTPGSLSWGTAWTRLDLGTTLTGGAQVRAASRADGGVTLSLLDLTTGLWISEQKSKDGPWAKAELIAPGIGLVGEAFADDQGDFGYAYADASGYLHVLTRDAPTPAPNPNDPPIPGDWDIQDVRIENGTKLVPVSVYRLGVIVTDASDGGAPVGGAAISLSADDEIAAMVNGQNLYFSRDDAHVVQTDGDGCIWLMADIENSLATPTFTVTSGDARFDEAITIRPEADAQTYATGASAEVLQNATDDTGAPLLAAGSPYDKIAANLAKLGASVAHIYAGQDHASPRLIVPARAGVRVLASGQRTLEQPVSAGYWSMRRENGQLTFDDHTPESAAQKRQAMIARVAASRGIDTTAADFAPDSIFDDWEDAFDSIVDAVCDLGDILIEGLTATVNFVVDGIERIVFAALDAVSVVVDAVKAVLNFAGAVLGRVVGWLVRAIGWLLGLPDLVGIKNDIKARIVTAVTGLTQALPDPATYVAPATAQIQTWKGDIDQLIDQYRSTPAGTQSNSEFFGGVRTVVSALTMGATSIMPEISWAIEKLRSVLPDLADDLPAVPDFGVTTPLTDLLSQAAKAEVSIGSFLADVVTAALESWIGSLDAMNGANIDPVLDVIKTHSDDLLDALAAMVQDLGDVFHALWVAPAPQTLIDWLDSSIDITFFSDFYEGLVGNDFSALDFIALAAAIPYSIIAPSTSTRLGEDSEADLFTAILSLRMVRTVFATLQAAAQEPASSTAPPSGAAKLVDLASIVLDICIGGLTVAYAAKDKAHWYAPAVGDLMFGVLKAISMWAADVARPNASKGAMATDIVSIFTTGVSGLLGMLTTGLRADMAGVAVASMVSDLTHLAVDQGKIDISNPDTRTAYIAFQSLLAATPAVIFQLDGSPDAKAATRSPTPSPALALA